MQDCSNSIANTLELLQSYTKHTKPLLYSSPTLNYDSAAMQYGPVELSTNFLKVTNSPLTRQQAFAMAVQINCERIQVQEAQVQFIDALHQN